VTSTTPTGAAAASSLFSEKISHRYLPYDLPQSVARFLDTVNPAVLLVLETEIWPNLYRQCRLRNIPIALINARLSEKSFTRYRLVSGLAKPTLQAVTVLAAQSNRDAERFISLGLSRDRVQVIGNLKFDIRIPRSVLEQSAAIRRRFSVQRPVWIAASTHEGEEELILRILPRIRKIVPGSLLILAPRHPHRAPRIRELCIKKSFKTITYTSMRECNTDTDIFILDVIGQLVSYLGAADVAFVGGSLVTRGGHNMLEPAALGRPVITGPYLFNFTDTADLLAGAGALIQVENPEELAAKVCELLTDANLRDRIGNLARKVVQENQGAVERLAGVLDRVIPSA